MKYEYMKEYKTNGEKPDLPGDVLVHVMFDGEWQDCDEFNAVKHWNWAGSQKFRIVDERWKPKDHIADVGKKVNDWYERGELPPVGEAVECSLDFEESKERANWNKIEVLYTDESTVVGRIIEGAHSHAFSNGFEVNGYKFRPLRTERDVLVEKAFNDIGRLSNDDDTYIIERLIAKGWRPIKQQTEDEFVDYGRKCLPDAMFTSQWIGLYRAGCRFVDVGDV